MSNQCIRVSRDGGVGILQVDRPGRHNALDLAGLREFLAATLELRHDAAVRAILITGTGDTFCPGADVGWLAAQGDRITTLLDEGIFNFHGALSRLVRMEKPLVTAVNGVAAGGGFSLALVGDLVLAREDARFVAAYSRIGVSPDGGLTFLLARMVGLRRAMELLLLNRELSAREALDWGLVTRVLPAKGFAEAALGVARELAVGPTLAYGRSRDLIYHSFNTELEAQMARETEGLAGSAMTQDFRAATRAFVDKQRATYQGK